MYITLKFIREPQPSERWQRFFLRVWPLYRAWWMGEGVDARPSREECRRALTVHMPELVPTYDRLCELAGGGDLEARFLSMWCPPPYMAGCSQAAWVRGNPTLVRNYDYDPRYFDGRFLGPVTAADALVRSRNIPAVWVASQLQHRFDHRH